MDAVINPICEKVIDCALLQVVKQVGYLLNYRDNFKELDEKVNQLQGESQRIQHTIEEEERLYGNQREESVQAWLDHVDNFIIEANALVGDSRQTGVRCQQWSCPNLKMRRKLSKMAKKMVESATNLQNEGNFGRFTFSCPIDYLESSYEALTFESREPIMKEMMEALKDPKKRMIGVYGLGGVGKTTLAEQVAKRAKNDKLFDIVVKARVGENPQLEKIQDDIAGLLNMKLDHMSVITRAFRVRKRIGMERSVLVILDDVRTTIKLEDIGIPGSDIVNLKDGGVPSTVASDLEKGKTSSKGNNVICKILMTSRNEDILLQMGSENNFRVELLGKAEAWHLFEVKAGLDVVEERRMLQIATQVVEKCACWPILISTMATTLKSRRSIHVWEVALNKLAAVGSNKEMHEIIYSALELSYSWLESNEMKALFLLCAVKGGYNRVGDLLKYGIGLGIFKHINTVEDARYNLYRMINSLKASCLLLDDTSMEFVTMHEIVREVAMSIASRDQYFFTKEGETSLKEWPKDDLNRRCPLMVLHGHCIQKLPERLDCPKLELLHLNSENNPCLNIPHSFFEGMCNLEVLDLFGLMMPSLPKSLAFLTKLKTLCLDRCDLGDIAEIGALENLEILSLLQSSMIQLPSEIRKLTHLKMLDLRESRIGIIPSNIISNLIKLEELYASNSTIKLEELYASNSTIKSEGENSTMKHENASLAEFRPLTNLIALEIQIQDARMLPKDIELEKLVRYKIIIGDIWDWTEEYEASKTLKLKLGFSVGLEHWVKALIKTVENLYLDEIRDISNVLYQLNENGLSPLKHLHIQNNAEVEHIVSSMWGRNQLWHVSFPNLETLSIYNLNKLVDICDGPLVVNSFSKLRVIKVKGCDQLVYLLLVSMVEALSQLVEIEVSQCNYMKTVVFMEDMDSDITIEFASLRSLSLEHLPIIDDFGSNMSSITKLKDNSGRINIVTSFFNAKLAFPNLETLKLSSVKLNKIWDDDQHSAAAHSLSNLAKLIMEDCGDLKYLFSSSMVKSLSNLKQLEISNCDMMEETIATERRNCGVATAEVPFSKLEKIAIKDMKNLKAVWHYQFARVKVLEVENCEKIGHIFPSHMQRTFENLETLTVLHCGSVEKIFELSSNGMSSEDNSTQLRNLTFLGLPMMKLIWSQNPQGILQFFNLQCVWIVHCPNLTSLDLIYLSKLHLLQHIIKKGSQIGPTVDVLEKLIVAKCSRLTIFVPSSMAFNHLTYLEVEDCQGLVSLIASSTARSLVKLMTMKIRVCNSLKQIVTKEEDVTEEEIVFNSLKFLDLECLPGLNSFSSSNCLLKFPSLEKVVVRQCLRMKFFSPRETSTPKLEKVKFEENDEDWYWENGLNRTINKMFIDMVGFRSFKRLQLSEYSELKVLWNGQVRHKIFSNLKSLVVRRCEFLPDVLLSSKLLQELSHLEELDVRDCKTLQVVFDLNGMNQKEMLMMTETIQLKKLTLSNIPALKHIWIHDSQEFVSFEKTRDLEEKVLFPKLETITISNMQNLKTIWHPVLASNSSGKLKTLEVNNCKKLCNIVPSYMLRMCGNLEIMMVSNCDSMEVIFELSANESCSEKDTSHSQLKELTLLGLQKLKQIWSRDTQKILSFHNLQVVTVKFCKELECILPFSIAMDLVQLEKLHVKDCGIKEIVADKEGPEDESPVHFVLDHLVSLELQNLYLLEGFYAGNNYTLKCQSLELVDVFKCNKLELFNAKSTSSHEKGVMKNEKSTTMRPSRGHPLFIELIPNLKQLTVNNAAGKITFEGQHQWEPKVLHVSNFLYEQAAFPIWLLQNIPNLEILVVEESSFEKIFEDKERQTRSSIGRLKYLRLKRLPRLEHICKEGSQIDPILEVLETIYVDGCTKLTHLVPSSVAFGLLKYLKVQNCNGLTYLFTWSTARSLVQLMHMNISECISLEEIIAEEEAR